MSVSHPLVGSLTITGRDLMLAVVMLVVGAAAIVVQVITMQAFRTTVAQGIEHVADSLEVGRRDRDVIISLLRAKTCAEALAIEEPDPPPKLRSGTGARSYVPSSDELRSGHKRGSE